MSHDNCGCCEHGSKYGCEQSLEEIDFEKSIFNACVYGDLERVKKFVNQKGKLLINSQDKNGYSSLHYAARNGHFDLCKYLLENGADVNLKTNSCKSTALHRAAYIGNKEIIKLLLDYKSSPSEQDCDGKTPMHKCLEKFLSKKDQKFGEALAILVKHHQDVVNIKDKNKKSPLDLYPDLLNLK